MSESSNRLKEIYSEALELESAEERSAYIKDICGNDQVLRADVESLLSAHLKADGFLSQAIPNSQTQIMLPSPESPGTMIGPYKIREQLGEGGMGVVYVADQTEPVRRRVALKVIKPGMDSKEIIGRFQAERQTLAMMSHPNIAKVLDGGTTENGRPYFVMELVKGIPITEFCDQQKLSIRERLELFTTACQAVQHAHMKGIIHRDLKPSNVMVELHDVVAVPKVIDFGISKATNQQMTQQTVYTQFSQLVGTPLYMSPEQAQVSGIDIDTRSDVYSLGVMLYELLTGVTPFDKSTLSSVGVDEMRRIIREDEPPRPSNRISTIEHQQISTISESRQTIPREMSLSMQRELDWIVMKALEKDRTRRYESANSLAADIQRYLDDEPVEACPPTVKYRLTKYAKRHKGLLTTATVMALTLLVATGVSVSYAVQADQERQQAGIARDDADEEKNKALAAKQLADQRLNQSRLDFDRALKALDVVVEQLSSAEFAQIPGVAKTRTDMLQQMLTLYEEIAEEHDNDPYARQQQGLAYRRITEILSLAGQSEEAEKAVNQGIVILEELLKENPKNGDHKSGLADLLFRRVHLSTRSQTEKLVDAERALLLWQGLVEAGINKHVGSVGLMHLKVAHLLPQDSPRVDQQITESIRIPESHGLTPHWDSYLTLAHRAEKSRDWDKAKKNYRRGIELSRKSANSGHLTSRGLHANNCSQFAQLLNSQGRPDEAREFHLEAIDVARQLYEEYGKIPAYESLLNRRIQAYLTDAGNEQQKEEALKFVDEFIATWPGVESFHVIRAPHLAKLNAPIAALSDAIKEFPGLPIYYRIRSELLADSGRKGDALADLDKAIGLDPHSGESYFARGKLKVQLNQEKEAMADFRAAFDNADVPIGHISYAAQETARDLIRSGKSDLAIELGQLVIEQDPDGPRGHIICGEANQKLKRHQVAIDQFTASIPKYSMKMNPAWLHKRRAVSHFYLKDYDKALVDLNTCLDLKPDDASPVWWIPLADVASCPDEEFKTGMKALANRAVELNNVSAAAYTARGRLNFALGLIENGEADFKKALELKPDDALTLNNAAWYLATSRQAKRQHLENAVAWAKQAVGLEPNSGMYANTLGVAHYRAGDFSDATVTLNKADELDSEKKYLAYNGFFLAMAHWKLDQKDEARQWYEKSVKWLRINDSSDEVLKSFQAEAAQLLGIPVEAENQKIQDQDEEKKLNNDNN